MKVCFKKVHEELLLKSESLEFLHREIQKNGVIKIKRTNLNLFFYFSKTVIAQQISYLIAEKIWKQFYESYEEKKTQSKNSESQSILIDLIKELQISERKKNTILMIYEMIQNKQLEIKEISKLSDIKLKKMLTDIKGVGSWTADNMLIFFFRRINVFPCEDLIIEKVKTKFEYLEKRKINFQKLYSPYLSVLSLHFWKLSKRIL